ncbi:MAG: valine--tRNA ligase [Candidatus Thermofonsia Clade 1 bacterium]|uniref:Valine--tRNA ligase n=1 Tax=Candidatus Thermofonsia Clade 1 bacterium TaxID=2364210 RepID=A0A2M8P1S6_9CHLR|nr:MAG: valine--tRNA ligase [Candidatus Thermofonsia Clade 1 bacterium]
MPRNIEEMPKNFNYHEAEPRLYRYWETNGWFKPECVPPDAKPFVIAIPPPNVTGELHLGHAMFVSVEDLMIRYERMRGKAALWIPGTDHAGIATQLMVERLLQEEGTSREAIGREAFLERAWQWKEKYGGTIVQQLRLLGASCDWDRERFTLDEPLSRAVREAFVRLWEQGLIYRGKRLINWSPGLQTAVSDLEVEYNEEPATLYHFKYPVEGGGFIPVATTRPETILGDTAVAVHPEDERYQQFIGRTAYVPILNRPIPIIADEYVDRAFGTGALKVTPGHDFSDYEIAQRHNLPILNIMNKDATLNAEAGPYQGLDRFVARERLWADMSAAGLTIKTEPYMRITPRATRGGEIIEPLLSEQWFVRMAPLAEKAIAAVRDGRIKIVPERFEKIYFNWLENIKDWCISRQLWWGHRIPVWYDAQGNIYVSREDLTDPNLTQDPDVLDTWFSSGLWPFSTLGWPDNTPDFQRFYPTDILETGYDILFFWVARMIMLGLWFTDQPPFHTVYLHGLVRDEHGEKMSKTKGNVIDPRDAMQKYSTDALRFTLLTGGTPGNDLNLAERQIEYGRNFGNKLWQIARFVLINLGEGYTPQSLPAPEALDLPSRWILSRLNRLIATVQRLFDNYLYGEAGRQIRDFLWDEFADWYVENSKNALYGDDPSAKAQTRAVLLHVLDSALRLLHPYMPYITEEIWSYLPDKQPDQPLILARWCEADTRYLDDTAEAHMDVLRDLIVKVRNVRAEYKVEPAKRLTAIADGGAFMPILLAHTEMFSRLCNVERLEPLSGAAPEQAATVISGEVTLYLPLAGMVDLSAERERLTKELAALSAQIEKTEKMLANEQFVSRAKPEVVAKERAKLAELQQAHAALQERLAAL